MEPIREDERDMTDRPLNADWLDRIAERAGFGYEGAGASPAKTMDADDFLKGPGNGGGRGPILPPTHQHTFSSLSSLSVTEAKKIALASAEARKAEIDRICDKVKAGVETRLQASIAREYPVGPSPKTDSLRHDALDFAITIRILRGRLVERDALADPVLHEVSVHRGDGLAVRGVDCKALLRPFHVDDRLFRLATARADELTTLHDGDGDGDVLLLQVPSPEEDLLE